MPTTSESAREQRISEAKRAADADAHSEKVRVPWMDAHTTLTVVSIPLDCVVLNPRSHRIRADLESHPDCETIAVNPFSNDAQAAIAAVVAGQEGFADLCESLHEHGQRDPGVVTAKGVLVNANRRAVALRNNGQEYIRVGVLPSDAGDREIDQLELRLQMQKEYKEPYSFTNELLFVKDLITVYGYSAERIAIELGWAASSDTRQLARGRAQVEQCIRILDVIRGFQHSSGEGVPIKRFDGAKQSLIELDDALQKVRGREDAARRIRDMRIAGILAGLGYEPLRQVDEDFVEEYLYPHMSESEDPKLVCCADELTAVPGASETQDPSGLELIDALRLPEEDPPRDPGPLLGLVAQVEATGRGRVPVPPGSNPVIVSRDWLEESLRPVILRAADEARDSRRADQSAGAPVAFIDAAIKKVQKASDAHDQARGRPGFDAKKLEFRLKKLAKCVEELRKKAGGD